MTDQVKTEMMNGLKKKFACLAPKLFVRAEKKSETFRFFVDADIGSKSRFENSAEKCKFAPKKSSAADIWLQ